MPTFGIPKSVPFPALVCLLLLPASSVLTGQVRAKISKSVDSPTGDQSHTVKLSKLDSVNQVILEKTRYKLLSVSAQSVINPAIGCIPQNMDLNQTVNGTFTTSSCHIKDIFANNSDSSYVDQYRLTVTQRGTLTVDLTSSAFDPFLYLTSSSLSRIASDDDSGGGNNAKIVQVLQPGTYLILANSVGIRTGAYTLKTSFRTPESCPVLVIGIDDSINSSLTNSDCRFLDVAPNSTDRSYINQYRLTIIKRGTLTIDLISSDFDAYLVLLDNRLNLITQNDDGGAGTNSRILRTIDPGTYILWVNSVGVHTGAYTLRTRFRDPQSCPVQDVALNEIVTSRLTTNECRHSELILSSTDQSYMKLFRVVLKERGTLTIDQSSSTFDAYLYLFTNTLGLITQDDDSGPNTNASISRILEPGTYLIAASSYYVSTGEFTLRLGFRNPGACPIKDIGLQDEVQGILSSGTCRLSDLVGIDDQTFADQYRVRVTQRGILTIDLKSNDFDSYLLLLDNRYKTLSEDDDSGGNRDSRIVRILEPGTYTILANSLNIASGRYNLRTSFQESGPIVYLLIHGINSSPAAWDKLSEDEFDGMCQDISLPYGSTILPISNCFKLGFTDIADDDDNEIIWHNGDGATLARLGQEVKLAVDRIVRDIKPSAILFVGHSRGGLAARAYLQSLTNPQSIKFALLTVGTPHQGSPLARIPNWMKTNISNYKDFKRGEIFGLGALRFLSSPSMATMATDHNSNKQPVRTAISNAIWDLNADVDKLSNKILYGQIVSGGLPLGQLYSVDLFDAFKLILNPSSLADSQKAFVINNLPDTWKSDTDGVVPLDSQRLHLLPRFTNRTYELELKKVDHVHETSQSANIRRLLDALVSDLHVDTVTSSSVTSSQNTVESSLPTRTFLKKQTRDLVGLGLKRGDQEGWASFRTALVGSDKLETVELLRLASNEAPGKTLPILLNLATSTNSVERSFRNHALGLVATIGKAKLNLELLEQTLLVAFSQRTPGDRELLIALAGGLSSVGTPASVENLLQFLDSGSASMEDIGVVSAALKEIQNPSAIVILDQFLTKDPFRFGAASYAAGGSLAAMGRPAATKVLLKWAAGIVSPREIDLAVMWLALATDRQSWNLISKFASLSEFSDEILKARLAALAKELFIRSSPKLLDKQE